MAKVHRPRQRSKTVSSFDMDRGFGSIGRGYRAFTPGGQSLELRKDARRSTRHRPPICAYSMETSGRNPRRRLLRRAGVLFTPESARSNGICCTLRPCVTLRRYLCRDAIWATTQGASGHRGITPRPSGITGHRQSWLRGPLCTCRVLSRLPRSAG